MTIGTFLKSRTDIAMNVKKLFSTFIIAIILFTASGQETEILNLASWNIRILSNNSRDDSELSAISQIITRYDLVAIQEVRDEQVIQRLIKFLPAGWNYLISDQVGRGVKERYAYLYDSQKVKPVGIDYVISDPEDYFIREPYAASFVSGNFDFTLLTFHAIYGDSIFDRRKEIGYLPDLIDHIQNTLGFEKDLILLGDFNLPSDDRAWSGFDDYKAVIPPSEKTTITDTSSYDNFWLHENFTFNEEFISLLEIYKFDELLCMNNDSQASKIYSDHRPIAITFDTRYDLDSEGFFSALPGPFSLREKSESERIESMDYLAVKNNDIVIEDVIKTPTENESISLRNMTNREIVLTNWTLGDKNSPESFIFPYNTRILPGQLLIIDHSILNFIINNTGEILYLKRPDGLLVAIWQD
jgi:deoxyribonuclease-1-like protein